MNICLTCSSLQIVFSEKIVLHLLHERKPAVYRSVQSRGQMLHLLLAQYKADPNATWKGATLLMLAVEMRDLETVKELLAYKANVNFHDKNGETALSIAIQQGSDRIVQQLLHCLDIDINGKEPFVRNPLVVALDHKQYHIFQILIRDTRVRVNRFIQTTDNPGHTILHSAVRDGDHFPVRILLNQPLVDVNLRNSNGDNALLLNVKKHWRLAEESLQIADYLIGHPDIDINAQDRERRSVLWHAVNSGCHNIVSAILEHKQIDVNLDDHEKVSPLMRAAELGYLEIVKTLLRHPDLFLQSFSSVPHPLWSACQAGHYSVVDYLLKQRSIDANQAGLTDTSPLLIALRMRHTHIAYLLLEKRPIITISIQDWIGITALVQEGSVYGRILNCLLQEFDTDGRYLASVRMLTRRSKRLQEKRQTRKRLGY